MLLVLSQAWFLLTSPRLWLPQSIEGMFLKALLRFHKTGKCPTPFFHISVPLGFLLGLTQRQDISSKYIFQPLVQVVLSLEWTGVERSAFRDILEWTEVLLTQLKVPLYPGFILHCSSNPLAISHTLLCWKMWVIKPFLLHLMCKHICRLCGH